MRKINALAALALASLFLTGCQSGEEASAGGDMALPGIADTEAAVETSTTAVQTEADMDASGIVDLSHVITTGEATIVTDEPDAASESFTETVVALGGYAEGTWKNTWENQRSSSVTARIPADKYSEAVASLSELGEVTSQSTNTTDVGLEVTDLEGRKTALETSIKRLTELMEDATSTEAVIQAESELTARQAELDGLNSQLNYLNDQVAMSTLSANFQTADYYDESEPGAAEIFWGSFRTMGFALLVALPWMIVLGILTGGTWFLLRHRKKVESTFDSDSASTEVSE